MIFTLILKDVEWLITEYKEEIWGRCYARNINKIKQNLLLYSSN